MIDLATYEPARAFLAAAGYEASIGETELDQKVPALFVDLLADEGEDAGEWLLQMTIVSDFSLAGDGAADPQDQDHEDVTLLQLTTVAPVLIEPEALVACMRAAFLVNTIMPIGGVGLIEAQRRFYFDHKLVLAERSVSELVLRETVDMMAFCAETYGTLLMEIAAGRMSVEDLLKLLQGEGDATH